MKRCLLCLALFLLAGCGSQTVVVTTQTVVRSASATTPAPSRTSSTPFATVTGPGSTATAGAPGALPAGGPVPPGFRATSISFVSPDVAYVLGTAPCQRPVCTSLLRTADRGGHWVGLPAPLAPVAGRSGPGLSLLRFADPVHGLAVGSQLWQTNDGGAHWSHGTLPPGQLVDLEPVADRQWIALMAVGRRLVIERCPVAGGGWQPVATSVVRSPLGVATGQLDVHGDTVWAALGSDQILRSSDDGASFVTVPEPRDPLPAAFIAADGTAAYLLVAGNPGAGSQDKRAYRLVSGAWQPQGSPPRGGLALGLATGGGGNLVVAATSGAALLYRSTDGGQNWPGAHLFRDGGEQLGDLGFTDARDGVVIEGPAASPSPADAGTSPGRLWLTEDGGANWHRVSF